MSMERATPLEQVQIVPLMLHAQGQVGCLVECSHRKGTERGLLPTPSSLGVQCHVRTWNDSVHRLHHGCVPECNALTKVNP